VQVHVDEVVVVGAQSLGAKHSDTQGHAGPENVLEMQLDPWQILHVQVEEGVYVEVGGL